MSVRKTGRSTYLINPSFQLKMVGYGLLLLVLSMGIFYMSNLYFIWKFIDLGRSLGFPETHPFFRFIVEQRRVLNTIFVASAAITTIGVVIGGILISHRIAGALYRLQSHIDEVAKTCELKDVNFRKGDFFAEVAESFNTMMSALRKTSKKNGE